MAEEEKAETEEEAAPKKSNALLFAVVGVLVGALAGGGVGFVLLSGGEEPAAESADAEDAEGDGEAHAESEKGVEEALEAELKSPAAAAKGAGGTELGETLKLEPFVVNINDRERDRYLKLKAELEVSSPEVAASVSKRLPLVRDVVITLLSSKSFEEIRTIEGKNFLREEIVVRLNAMLSAGAVRRVFFTEFVVQ